MVAMVFWTTMALKVCPYPVVANAAAGAVDFNGWGQTIFNAIFGTFATGVGGVVAYLVAQFSRLKAERDEKMEELAGAKVDAKTAELRSTLAVLARDVAALNQRLDRGDGQIDRLVGTDTKIQVEVAMQMRELESTILRQCASKDDVRELRGMLNQLLSAGREP